MRKVAACLGLLVGASSAFGGVVTFAPNPVIIDPAVTTVATMGVSVSPTEFANMQSVDMIIGSDDLNITAFAYTPEFIAATAFRGTPQFDQFGSIYPQSASNIGGFLNAAALSVLVGTVTIDAAGLAAGEYTVLVSAQRDDTRSNTSDEEGNIEGLAGSVRVVVVPEPATLALLCIGTVGLIRRRFA